MTADIREITQAQFDGMVAGQQKFFLEQISKGRAKIVPDGALPIGHVYERKPVGDPTAFTGLQGRDVTVSLVDGTSITGVLNKVWKFEITIREGDREITVMKHGIVMVREGR